MQPSSPKRMMASPPRIRALPALMREFRGLLAKEVDESYLLPVGSSCTSDSSAVATRRCIFTYYLELLELYGDVDPEMVYTAINLYDRFLPLAAQSPQSQDVAIIHQLAALVALSIASKVHGCRIFTQGELAKLSGDRFSPGDLTLMEIQMLRVLNWSIHPTTPKTVLEYMKHIIFYGHNAHLLSSCVAGKMDYYLDIACSDYLSLQFPPSAVAWVCLNAGIHGASAEIVAGIEGLRNELLQGRGGGGSDDHAASSASSSASTAASSSPASVAAALEECQVVIGGILATACSGEEAELSGFSAAEMTPKKAPKGHPHAVSRQTSPDSVLRSISPPAVSAAGYRAGVEGGWQQHGTKHGAAAGKPPSAVCCSSSSSGVATALVLPQEPFAPSLPPPPITGASSYSNGSSA